MNTYEQHSPAAVLQAIVPLATPHQRQVIGKWAGRYHLTHVSVEIECFEVPDANEVFYTFGPLQVGFLTGEGEETIFYVAGDGEIYGKRTDTYGEHHEGN